MSRTLASGVVLSLAVAAMAALLRGQVQPDQKPSAFEVASIKPNLSGQEQEVIRTPRSGLITATNVSVRMLLRYAYDVPEILIDGLPSWTSTEHFDVAAKARAGSSLAEMRLMFRSLLAERFAVMAHTEARSRDVEVLTVKEPGRLGPGLKPSTRRCDSAHCGTRMAFGHIESTDAPMKDLVSALAVMTRRVVLDHTGLNERYSFSLTYTPDAVVLQPSVRAEFPLIDPGGASLSTALREQLGLQLQSTKASVDVLVIDHVERPTPD